MWSPPPFQCSLVQKNVKLVSRLHWHHHGLTHHWPSFVVVAFIMIKQICLRFTVDQKLNSTLMTIFRQTMKMKNVMSSWWSNKLSFIVIKQIWWGQYLDTIKWDVTAVTVHSFCSSNTEKHVIKRLKEEQYRIEIDFFFSSKCIIITTAISRKNIYLLQWRRRFQKGNLFFQFI